jgi:hypothetical protein
MKSQRKGDTAMTDERRKDTAATPAKVKELITAIAEQGNLSQFLELYYWSCEPGFLDIVRAFAAMPESARAAVEAFASMAHDPASVTATWDRAGRLVLTSPQVGQTIAIAQHCAEYDDNGKPPLLH